MAEIHPSAVIHKDVELGEAVVLGPNCVVNSGSSIGAGTVLDANVVIEKNVKIGENNHFFSNSVIGARPQVLALQKDAPVGGLIIGNGNTFREQVTIHSSMHAGEFTRIGNNNFLMVGTHIGHDCVLEDDIVVSNCAQVSGHCKIERGAWLSGVVAMHQFVTLGKWCYVAGLAGINKDVPPFLTVSGHYPPVVRGVNKRGMKRAGLSEAAQQRIYEAYKRLYRRGGTLLANANAMAEEGELDDNVRAIIEAIRRSSMHRYGRYLETLRSR